MRFQVTLFAAVLFIQALGVRTNCSAAEPNEAEPPLTAKVGRDDSRIEISSKGDAVVLDVSSPFGIDKATIRRKGERWPTTILIRLHLKGLESFKAASGDDTVEWSVSSTGDHAARAALWRDGKEIALPPDHPLYSAVRIQESDGKIPLKRGYFEISLPKPLFADNPAEIEVRWIDFYRN
jgi:hypothetical protein